MDVSQLGAKIAIGLTDFSNKYLEKLNNISNGNLFVTDKMPHNFRYIGLICAAFPDSKIIHVKRNPAAVCWANYKQYFSSKNFGYSCDLIDVVNYFKLYENIMKFWSYKLSNRILDFDYEILTANQEAETKRLINFLDLYWDEKCLSPEDNDRSVGTISNSQIRQKIYKGSSEKWKIYQPFLDGAFDSLFDN